MVGRCRLLTPQLAGGILFLLAVAAASCLHAQDSPTPAPAPTAPFLKRPPPTAGVAGEPRVGPRGGAILERFSPPEREAFQRNLQLWRDLSPAEREALREHATQRRERRRRQAERALAESGLYLGEDQRENFALRYAQERRKLERELRQQMRAERARRLPAITTQLRSEFGPGAFPAERTSAPGIEPSRSPAR